MKREYNARGPRQRPQRPRELAAFTYDDDFRHGSDDTFKPGSGHLSGRLPGRPRAPQFGLPAA